MALRRTLASGTRGENIAIEKLLGGQPTRGVIVPESTNGQSLASVRGRRVLLTGAGGSIGSELALQIARLGPVQLCLADLNEYNLYRIGLMMAQVSNPSSWSHCLVDVRDEVSMRHLFMRERPDIVFHAAALKHVPLLEDHNVVEAVRTNVLGTKVVSDLCAASGSEFVMISTDKAVNPSSRMGLTKRVAEILLHDKALRHPETRMSLVRFGNVLGSSGSVVPLFRKQIEDGGPVTVTHPGMTRYLMTIQDAVRLTLAASGLPQSGFPLYVLDMGKPVRILDLAIQLIELSGLKPFVDIDIEFIGVRPGEKLHEELSYPWERLNGTAIAGVNVATPEFDPSKRMRAVNDLLAAADARDCEWVKRTLVEIVPEYLLPAPEDDKHSFTPEHLNGVALPALSPRTGMERSPRLARAAVAHV